MVSRKEKKKEIISSLRVVANVSRQDIQKSLLVGNNSALLSRTNMLHLDACLGFDIAGEVFALLHSVALVPFYIRLLELHVGGRSGAAENRNPILQNIALSEGPMTVRFRKLVGIEIFSCGFTTANQKQMVCP